MRPIFAMKRSDMATLMMANWKVVHHLQFTTLNRYTMLNSDFRTTSVLMYSLLSHAKFPLSLQWAVKSVLQMGLVSKCWPVNFDIGPIEMNTKISQLIVIDTCDSFPQDSIGHICQTLCMSVLSLVVAIESEWQRSTSHRKAIKNTPAF